MLLASSFPSPILPQKARSTIKTILLVSVHPVKPFFVLCVELSTGPADASICFIFPVPASADERLCTALVLLQYRQVFRVSFLLL